MITVFNNINMNNPVLRCDNSELVSTDGLYIRRFDDELFIAHPDFQYNLKLVNVVCTYELSSFIAIRNLKDKNYLYLLFVVGEFKSIIKFYDRSISVNTEEIVIIKDFLQPIIKCYDVSRWEKPPSW